ncbi:hypothetical protein [Stappia sp. BW2]|uniref:hypothetical protein n=1 Tax=Stappia sp. BW2 TaxID=2592622 RepID=UPI001AD90D8F|nr:hypothetical protein [Stappia sp. BW2]
MLTRVLIATAILVGSSASGSAEDADLAKRLSNPVAALISVPLQWNYNDML